MIRISTLIVLSGVLGLVAFNQLAPGMFFFSDVPFYEKTANGWEGWLGMISLAAIVCGFALRSWQIGQEKARRLKAKRARQRRARRFQEILKTAIRWSAETGIQQ